MPHFLERLRFAARSKVAALVLGGIAALILQEYAIRLALPKYDPTQHLQFTATGPYALPLGAPGKTERQGQEHRRLRRDGALQSARIPGCEGHRHAGPDDYVLVGDSFPFGWGVPEQDRISERLQALVGHRVFNISTPTDIDGYGNC